MLKGELDALFPAQDPSVTGISVNSIFDAGVNIPIKLISSSDETTASGLLSVLEGVVRKDFERGQNITLLKHLSGENGGLIEQNRDNTGYNVFYELEDGIVANKLDPIQSLHKTLNEASGEDIFSSFIMSDRSSYVLTISEGALNRLKQSDAIVLQRVEDIFNKPRASSEEFRQKSPLNRLALNFASSVFSISYQQDKPVKTIGLDTLVKGGVVPSESDQDIVL